MEERASLLTVLNAALDAYVRALATMSYNEYVDLEQCGTMWHVQQMGGALATQRQCRAVTLNLRLLCSALLCSNLL